MTLFQAEIIHAPKSKAAVDQTQEQNLNQCVKIQPTTPLPLPGR
jgi:hypothetical protein